MSTTNWIILLAVLGFIISGVYYLYKTARKFNLTEEQKRRIAERNKALDEEERKDQ
ncbi:DUF2897 family protein [Thalassotalea mangrovi]|uniref:DUF2897 family protein n=1 Tax=Thalassotalea mangrovi TaxID=2572245 RepID=A0A4U1B4P4_9GAMM|nr:DUF2897 family protein [Thalassotalea mangrovi]TKB45136.1 DUF2897 family protein [Thalassotalea mangrovi]